MEFGCIWSFGTRASRVGLIPQLRKAAGRCTQAGDSVVDSET
jgi:hypothetical protein